MRGKYFSIRKVEKSFQNVADRSFERNKRTVYQHNKATDAYKNNCYILSLRDAEQVGSL